MATASEQSKAISNALAELYKGRSQSIGLGGDDPAFSTIENRLVYDELLRRATQDYSGAADAATAVSVEQVHEVVAVLREHGLASRTRYELYGNMASEYSSESDYYADRATFLTSILDKETIVPYLE